ncbi:MAG TPA: nitroreductase family protein, partial [Rectinemataceae bacterium]
AAAGAGPAEIVPAVIALGLAASRPSLAERIVRGAARARTRKPVDEIARVGKGSSVAGLPKSWRSVLEAVRAAPSASNKQPWRLVAVGPAAGADFEDLAWDLYMDEDYAYNRALGAVRIQNIDMGIAMRHFSIAASAFGLRGSWRSPSASERLSEGGRSETGPERGWKLIASWR